MELQLASTGTAGGGGYMVNHIEPINYTSLINPGADILLLPDTPQVVLN